jgi:SulP family sulfate permease
MPLFDAAVDKIVTPTPDPPASETAAATLDPKPDARDERDARDAQRPQVPVTPLEPERPRQPKLIAALRGYTLKTFVADVTAGVTVGLVALPLAMAFAISSGVPPESGIYCAIVTGFLISALGGSRVQIGGPTGAFVVVVAGIIATYGIEGLFLCTMMGGVMLVILGATGMGTAVKYIPRPVVFGFTNGISVIIASTQIKDFFGLTVQRMPGDFVGRMAVLGQSFNTINISASLLAAACLTILIVCLRRQTRIPGTIIALMAGTLVSAMFGMHVDTIQTRFHGIPSGLPDIQFPTFHPSLLLTLLLPAFTVAMLGAIESLMSAVVADRLSGDRHNPNVELVAQGIANIASPLFGGLPATGAIARTATNIRSGAKTPIAGIVHAITLLLIVIFAAPLAGYIPMPVLAAILFAVAWNMGEWKELPTVFRMSRTDIAVWLVTFVLTVFADLTEAVEVGMALAALVFIRRVATTTTVADITEEIEKGRADTLHDKEIPPYVVAFRINGPFLFGATDKLKGITDRLDSLPPIVILRLRYMTATDATGLQAIEDLADAVRASGRAFLVSGAQSQPAALMKRARIDRHLGEENVCATFDEALDRARAVFRERFQPGFPRGSAEIADPQTQS